MVREKIGISGGGKSSNIVIGVSGEQKNLKNNMCDIKSKISRKYRHIN